MGAFLQFNTPLLKALFSPVHLFFIKSLLIFSSSSETNPSDQTSPNNDFVINIEEDKEGRDHDDAAAAQHNSHQAAAAYLGKTIIQFCFGAAVGFQQLQPQQISLSFKLLYVFVLLAFSTSLGGILLRLKYPFAAKVLETMGIMFAAIVFFLSMDIFFVPHCKSLQFLTWFICAISLILILFHSICAYV